MKNLGSISISIFLLFNLLICTDMLYANNGDYDDSPFGVCRPHMCMTKFVRESGELKSDEEIFSLIEDFLEKGNKLNLRWARIDSVCFGCSGYKRLTKNTMEGPLNFSRLDRLVSLYQDNGFKILMMLGPHGMTDHPDPYIPQDMTAYREYVQAVVERYDGDGESDMPGIKYPIKYWECDNEVDVRGINVEDYCDVLKATYEEVKDADPAATVLFAGLTGRGGTDYYNSVMETCDNIGDYFDIADFHFYPGRDSPNEAFSWHSDLISTLKNLVLDKPIWITESSVPSQEIPNIEGIHYNTQNIQAEMLIKIHVSSLARGVEKVFWWMLMDVEFRGIRAIDGFAKNSFYDYPAGNAKLSAYTLRLLIEKLEDSDWDNTEIIQESDNIYAYKFIKKDTGKPVWIAWWEYFDDSGSSKAVTLNIGDINQVKITEAVPNTDSGEDLNENDYPHFFDTENKTVNNGNIIITLGENPVFIEETSDAPISSTSTTTIPDESGGGGGGGVVTTSIPTTSSSSSTITTTTTTIGPLSTTTTTIAPATTTILSEITADFTGSQTLGLTPLAVNFKELCEGNIVSYSWDFGDGSTSTGQNPSHTYTTAGNYTVTLAVSDTDDTSKIKVKSNYIVVQSSCPFVASLESQEEIKTLRNFRNHILKKNILGYFLIYFYYRHSAEATEILLQNPEIKDRLKNLVSDHITMIDDVMNGGEFMLENDGIIDIIDLLEDISVKAKPKLKIDINMVIKNIKEGSQLERLGFKTE